MGKNDKLEIKNKSHGYNFGEMRFSYDKSDPVTLVVKSPHLRDHNSIEVVIENIPSYAIEAMQEKTDDLPRLDHDQVFGAAVEMLFYLNMALADAEFKNKAADQYDLFHKTRKDLNRGICETDVGTKLTELINHTNYRFEKSTSNYKLNA